MPHLFILYGSATGNSQQIAKDLALNCKTKKITSSFQSIICCEANQYKRKCQSLWASPPESTYSTIRTTKHALLIVISTTGNGDIPENASRFVRYIQHPSTHSTKPFLNIVYSVLALGDTNYDYFCNAGKITDKNLENCGAKRIKELACADEALGLENVVEEWLQDIVATMWGGCYNYCDTKNPNSMDKISSDNIYQNKQKKSIMSTKVCTTTSKVTTNRINRFTIIRTKYTVSPITTTNTTIPQEFLNPSLQTTLFILYSTEITTKTIYSIAQNIQEIYQSILQTFQKKCLYSNVISCSVDKFRNYEHIWSSSIKKKNHRVVIIISNSMTEFDFTSNCSRFLRYINRLKIRKETPFQNCNYAIVGLSTQDGDCTITKKLDESMKLLGGIRMISHLGIKDDFTYKYIIVIWMEKLGRELTVLEQEEIKNNVENAFGEDSVGIKRFTYLLDNLSLLNKQEIPSVEDIETPSLVAPLVTCQIHSTKSLYPTDMESLIVNNTHKYTLDHPWESTILHARYLTNTKLNTIMKDEIFVNNELETLSRIMKYQEDLFPLNLEKNRKRAMELTLSLPKDYSLDFKPGDSIGLLIPNKPESITFITNILQHHHDLQQTMKIDEIYVMKIQRAITHYLDLSSVLTKRHVLLFLSKFCRNKKEEKILRLLSSNTTLGKKIFHNYITESCLTIINILYDFPSCRGWTIHDLLAICPRLTPRYYSICSCPYDTAENLQIKIAFSIVDYMTPCTTRRIGGLATRYLEAHCTNFLSHKQFFKWSPPKVSIFLKPTDQFHLTDTIDKPLVFIGPGTGIAPFIAFLSLRQEQVKAYFLKQMTMLQCPNSSLSITTIGDVHVYFGCRWKTHDWLYQQELLKFCKNGTITKLYSAFSREQTHKYYVQHLLNQEENSQSLTTFILNQEGSVYICGDGNKMAKDVQNTFTDLLAKKFSKSNDGEENMQDYKTKAKKYIMRMKQEKRFLMDIWS